MTRVALGRWGGGCDSGGAFLRVGGSHAATAKHNGVPEWRGIAQPEGLPARGPGQAEVTHFTRAVRRGEEKGIVRRK